MKGMKTYIAVGLTLLATCFLLLTGQVETDQAVQLISTALIGAGLRAGISGK